MESVSPRNNDLIDSMSSRSPSISSNGTPENKESKSAHDFLTSHSPNTTYSRRLVERKQALFKQQATDKPLNVSSTNSNSLIIERVEPSGKVGSRTRAEQRPEQKIARRNKERERKHLVKESLTRLASLLPEHSTGSRTKITLDVVKDACDVISQLQEQSRRLSHMESALSSSGLPSVSSDTNRRYERLLTLAGIPLDTDPDVLEAQLSSVTGPSQPAAQPSPTLIIAPAGNKSNKTSSDSAVQPKSVDTSQAPYLVVSPNGSCTLSTDITGKKDSSSNKAKSANPLDTLASVAIPSDKHPENKNSAESHESNSDLLLMMACPAGDSEVKSPESSVDKQKLCSTAVTSHVDVASSVTMSQSSNQILLAGGSLPPSSLPQVLLLPDGRLVPVSMSAEASHDAASRPNVQLSPAKKTGPQDTSAAKLSVVQPGQRAILPKIAAKPVASASGHRPIAPRRPIAPQPSQNQSAVAQPTNNFPVIFLTPSAAATSGAPVASQTVIGSTSTNSNQIVTLPISSLPPGLVPSSVTPSSTVSNTSQSQAATTQQHMTGEESIQNEPSFNITVLPAATASPSTKHCPEKQASLVEENVTPFESKSTAVSGSPEPFKTDNCGETAESLMASMVQPDESFLLPEPNQNEISSKSDVLISSHKESSSISDKPGKTEEKHAKSTKPKVVGGKKMSAPKKALKASSKEKSANVAKSGEIEIYLPPLSDELLANKPISNTPNISEKKVTSKSTNSSASVAKKKTSPLTKKLTVVETPPSREQDLLPESAISLLVEPPVEKTARNSQRLIELPLDLSVPILEGAAKSVLKPKSAKPTSGGKKVANGNSAPSQIDSPKNVNHPKVQKSTSSLKDKSKVQKGGKSVKKTTESSESSTTVKRRRTSKERAIAQKPDESEKRQSTRQTKKNDNHSKTAPKRHLTPSLERETESPSKRIMTPSPEESVAVEPKSLSDDELNDDGDKSVLSRPLSALVAERNAEKTRLDEEDVDPFDRLVALSNTTKAIEESKVPSKGPSRTSSVLSYHSEATSPQPVKEIEAITDKEYEQPPKAPAPVHPPSPGPMAHSDNAPPPLDDDYEPPHAPRPADTCDVLHEMMETSTRVPSPQPSPHHHIVEEPPPPMSLQQPQEPSPMMSTTSGASVPLHHIPDERAPSATPVQAFQPAQMEAPPPPPLPPIEPQQQPKPVEQSQQQQPPPPQQRRSNHSSSSSHLNPFLLSNQASAATTVANPATNAWFGDGIERPQSSAPPVTQYQPPPDPSSCSYSQQQQQQQTSQVAASQRQRQNFGVPASSSKRSKIDIQTAQAVVDSQLGLQAQALLAPFLTDTAAPFASTFSNMLLGQSQRQAGSTGHQSTSQNVSTTQSVVDNAMLNLLQSAGQVSQANPFLMPTSTHQSMPSHHSSLAPQSSFCASQKFNQTAAQSFLSNIFPSGGPNFNGPNSQINSQQRTATVGSSTQQFQAPQFYPSASDIGNLFTPAFNRSGPGNLNSMANSMASMPNVDLMQMSSAACRLSGQPNSMPGAAQWQHHQLMAQQQQPQLQQPMSQPPQLQQPMSRNSGLPHSHFNPFGQRF